MKVLHYIPDGHYLDFIVVKEKKNKQIINLLEEVTPTIQFTVSRIALFTQYTLTLTTLDAVHVPRFI